MKMLLICLTLFSSFAFANQECVELLRDDYTPAIIGRRICDEVNMDCMQILRDRGIRNYYAADYCERTNLSCMNVLLDNRVKASDAARACADVKSSSCVREKIQSGLRPITAAVRCGGHKPTNSY